MVLMRAKKSQDMSGAELELQEVYELINNIKSELKEIKALTDESFIKASMSHSLIVVRKIEDTKLEKLKELLD